MNTRELSFNEAYDFISQTLYVNQMKTELRILHTLISEYIPTPKTILEIGIRDGANLCLLSRFLDQDGLAIGIDPEQIITLDTDKVQSFILPAKFHFIKGLSQDYNILGSIYDLLKDRKVDILFIDGDHAYESVKTDYELYSQLVKSPGIIVIHDIGDYDGKSIGTTVEYWFKELRKKHPYVEIVSNPPICGLGVVYK